MPARWRFDFGAKTGNPAGDWLLETALARSALTGTRIRERRILVGMRQAELARRAGISASYLNLIEHNRRPIGPELLSGLAQALGVEEPTLRDGAGIVLIDGLRDAAASAQSAPVRTADEGPVAARGAMPEIDRIEDFAGRFPGWAALVAQQQARLATLERTLERLTDRMAHDPFLSASLHEILSAASSLRSTATILHETEDLEPDWQRRFIANLHDDSRRLADGAQALVGYLDAAADAETSLAAPQEEVEAWLAAQEYHIAALEGARAPDAGALIEGRAELASGAARKLARRHLARARADAEALPLARLVGALATHGADPARLVPALQVDSALLFRRLASLPAGTPELPPCGLVVCDGSGTLTFRKPLAGFGLPRFGAACPLWPLYQALARPMVVLRHDLTMAGRIPQGFRSYAVCQPQGVAGLGAPQVLEATMLLLPAPEGAASPPGTEITGDAALVVGTSCRICPRAGCPARREPSILEEDY